MPDPVLVLLTPAFAEFEGDAWIPGAESFVRACNQLHPGLKIVVLTFHFPVRNERTYSWYGNRILTFSGAHKKGKIRSVIRWKRVWAELDRIRSANELIGIFSMFCSECAFVGQYFSRRHNLRHRIWVMGQDARKSNNQVRRIRPRPEELICISDFLLREFERNHGVRPAHMIPCGIPGQQLQEHPVRDIDILSVGSLIPLKQYDWLIGLVERLLLSNPRLHVVLVGEGKERRHLETLIEQKHLQGIIRLTGRIPHPDVLSMMRSSRLLFHPSSYEGLGLVCLEALSVGTPVLSSCKPFDQDIRNWHIAKTVDEMAETAAVLLKDDAVDHTPVLPYGADETARAILNLYI